MLIRNMANNKKFPYMSRHVASILEIDRKKLHYWRKSGILKPSADRTKGGHYQYTFRDLIAIKKIQALIEKGIGIGKLKMIVDNLNQRFPEIDIPLAEKSLYVLGEEVIIADEKMSFNPLTGQGTFISNDALKEEVRKETRDLFDIPSKTDITSSAKGKRAIKSKVTTGG